MLLRWHSEGLKGSRSFAQDVFAGLRARPADTLGCSHSLLDVPHSSNALHPGHSCGKDGWRGRGGGGVLSRPVLPWCDGQCQPLAPSEGEPRSRVFLRAPSAPFCRKRAPTPARSVACGGRHTGGTLPAPSLWAPLNSHARGSTRVLPVTGRLPCRLCCPLGPHLQNPRSETKA